MPKTLISFRYTFICCILFCTTYAQDFKSAGQSLTVESLLKDEKDVVWGFDFLDSDQIIFTLRNGAIKIFNIENKKTQSIGAVPKVWQNGQGGLLDIRVHPKNSKRIFLTYSEPMGDKATTALASADLDKDQIKNFKKLFSAEIPNKNEIHFGSRIEFDDDDHLFVTVGDRNDRPSVQNKSTHLGKVLRLNLDGTVPTDNPFYYVDGAKKEIWSLGHRSPQGLSWRKDKKQLWQAEMGPMGGDEINLIIKGANYGWPIVTYGREYHGPKIGEGAKKEGMQEPIIYWVPSISPSGIAFYSGDKISKWKGNLFVGNLSGSHIRRLVLNSDKVVQEEELLKDMGLRFRNIRMGPDGWLYFSTDQGQIMRIKNRTKGKD